MHQEGNLLMSYDYSVFNKGRYDAHHSSKQMMKQSMRLLKNAGNNKSQISTKSRPFSTNNLSLRATNK
jgi:hypothetical protein